jgi:DNA polymerase-4
LQRWFGKWGLSLHVYANGLDTSPVSEAGDENVVKSVGNSTTAPRDLQNERDAHIVFLNLSESVAERMRELGLQARTVEISLRRNDLTSFTRQTTLPIPTHISTELCAAAMRLLREHYKWEKPLRSIGVRGTNLVPIGQARQLSLFEDNAKREKAEKLEYAIDDIRRRFGHFAVNRALLCSDPILGREDAKSTHTIHPIGYL